MINVVNGYVCRDCADVALAKKGVDPANPQDDPQSPNYNPAEAKADHGPAFQLAGALTARGVAGAATDGVPPVNAVGGLDQSAASSSASTPSGAAPTSLNITV